MTGIDDTRLARELHRLGAGPVVVGEPLSRHTTFRLGGPADLSVWPPHLEALVACLRFLRMCGVPALVVGAGSHLVVPDAGVRAVVVHTSRLTGLRVRAAQGEVWAEAGAPLAALATAALRAALAGLEFAADIPGRVGASVAMNAGAYGVSLGERLREAWVLDPTGTVVSRVGPAACGFRPHESALLRSGATVLAATFALTPADRRDIARTMSALARRRRARQPRGRPTFGCMFANPPGESAGALIDRAGLKGRRLGGTRISERHANFVLNLGHARYAEVVALMDLARARVRATYGIELRPEVRVVGEDGAAVHA